MKIKIVYYIVLSIIFTFSCCTDSSHSKKLYYGGLTTNNRYYDIGKIDKTKHDYIDFKFEIYNKTDSVIKIKKIDVSCGCVEIKEYPKVVYPQSSIKINGLIDLTLQEGYINKPIYINYEKDRLLLLRVFGEIFKNEDAENRK